MTKRAKEQLLIWIIVVLLFTLATCALALWRFAGNAHFLIVPQLGKPKEKTPAAQKLYFDRDREAVTVIALGRSARWGNKESRSPTADWGVGRGQPLSPSSAAPESAKDERQNSAARTDAVRAATAAEVAY